MNIRKQFDKKKKDYFQFGAVLDGEGKYSIYSYTFQMSAKILCICFDISSGVYEEYFSPSFTELQCQNKIEKFRRLILQKMVLQTGVDSLCDTCSSKII